jgi:hypothetical protein
MHFVLFEVPAVKRGIRVCVTKGPLQALKLQGA